MALQATQTTPQGVDAHFHIIRKFDGDPIGDTVELTVYSYRDQTAFEVGKSHLWVRRYTVSGNNFDTYMQRSKLQEKGSDPITNGEDYLVNEISEWTNATIV
uniref:Uncharacterized protein n=1 Tax=uncultured virus TaxID=340016 RepID=D5L2I5_9VIRU|nr:hypothetical protein [uncultured virus]